MARKVRLQEAVDEYLAVRKSEGMSPGTVRNIDIDLTQLITVTGNIYVTSLEPWHVDALFAAASRRRGPGSLNNLKGTLNRFFKWCHMRHYMDGDQHPMGMRRAVKVPVKIRRRLSPSQFPALLDAAEHPRDRIIIALGLYLLLRGGEIKTLRVGDVDLEAGEVRVTVHKTRDADLMPISAELDTKLRRWLTWYAENVGPLRSDWFLAPRKYRYRQRVASTGRFMRAASDAGATIRPDLPIGNAAPVVQRLLEDIGFPLRDEDGKSLREGGHTLRRSGARVLFDELRDMGYDGSRSLVQATLHHASGDTTDRYIGIREERASRDKLLRGRSMYPSLAADNVVSLDATRESV